MRTLLLPQFPLKKKLSFLRLQLLSQSPHSAACTIHQCSSFRSDPCINFFSSTIFTKWGVITVQRSTNKCDTWQTNHCSDNWRSFKGLLCNTVQYSAKQLFPLMQENLQRTGYELHIHECSGNNLSVIQNWYADGKLTQHNTIIYTNHCTQEST